MLTIGSRLEQVLGGAQQKVAPLHLQRQGHDQEVLRGQGSGAVL